MLGLWRIVRRSLTLLALNHGYCVCHKVDHWLLVFHVFHLLPDLDSVPAETICNREDREKCLADAVDRNFSPPKS